MKLFLYALAGFALAVPVAASIPQSLQHFLGEAYFQTSELWSSETGGRAGTVTEGRIFLNYDGGPAGRNTAAHIVVFNLSWLLDGQDIHGFIE